jgi:replication factor C subunit 3/5
MFFIDKYLPKSINDIDKIFFHQELIEKLEYMCKDETMPHIIFYGPHGSGKKTLINMFLEILYDSQINKLGDTNYVVKGSGGKPTNVIVQQSNYHIVIEPNNNNFDRYLIQDVVKEYAKRKPLDIFTTSKVFKTVLINNLENMSYYAQTSLRRTMEKYSSTCRFVMWCRSLSKVIEPLKSRCICIKVEPPNDEELFAQIYLIGQQEKINLSINSYHNIVKKSENNVKKALWMLENKKYKKTITNTYDDSIIYISTLILSAEVLNILKIREEIYDIIKTNIDGTQIIKDLVKILYINDKIPYNVKVEITETASQYEHNLIRGRREMMHLEGFIIKTMLIIKKSLI